jgi:hypothetical protein
MEKQENGTKKFEAEVIEMAQDEEKGVHKIDPLEAAHGKGEYAEHTSLDEKRVLKTDTPDGMELAFIENINNVDCEIYKAFGFDGAITREKLGAALGYANPRDAIARIHARHKERLDARSVVVKLSTTDGKSYDTYVYSIEGALEICR